MIDKLSSMLNSRMRVTGFSSGLDIDSIVEQLMRVEMTKVNKVTQEKTRLEWKRDDYRSITNLLMGFKSQYFDVLNMSTNFRSAAAFASFTSTSSSESVLTVTAGTGATARSFDVTVTSIAAAAKKTGTSGVSSGYDGLTGANPVNMSEMKQGKAFNVTLDGVVRTITLDRDYTGDTAAAFAASLEGLLDSAFGTNMINVTENAGVLTFTPANSSSTISIGDSVNTYLGVLGFSNGQSNALLSGSISDFSGGKLKIAIDSGTGVEIDVAAAADRDTLVANINSALSAAGLDTTVKAIADTSGADKIKFVTLDTTKKVTFTAGSDNDLLAKLGISNGSALNPLQGTIGYSASDIGKDFYISINGAQHHIELKYDYTSDTYTDPEGRTLAQAIQEQLDSGGATGVTVNVSDGKISFSNPDGYEIKMEKGDDGLREELGFSSTVNSTRINLNDKLQDINLATGFTFDGDGYLSFRINDRTFTVHKDETLSSVLNRINTSDAGVNIRYDSLNDKFIMETKDMGSTAYINNTDTTGNFFAALKIDTTAEVRGTNAVLNIDGTKVERTSNKFTIEGIAYDIKAAGTATVTISANPDTLIEKIKGFVTKYNEVIAKINGELNEKSYRDYLPLTDEQKSEMKDKDIELWEEKAKSGLLRNDSILQNILYSMRKALYDKIEGVDISLYDIGITVSSNYMDGGQLVINEDKLRQAIIDNPDKVAQLFSKESQYSYEDSANRSARYNGEGIAQRLYDIIQDNVRTTRDSNGKKGILLEKAGIAGDITEFDSLIVDEIKAKERLIQTLYEKLLVKENTYYAKFTAMETMINQMNSQSAWLSQQFGQQQ